MFNPKSVKPSELAIHGLMLARATDALLVAYERATPNIDQKLVSRTLAAMQRQKQSSARFLEWYQPERWTA